MSMFSDWLDNYTEEEIKKMKENSSLNLSKRIAVLEEKRNLQQISKQDFQDILYFWNLQVQINPQWRYPLENPAWASCFCQECAVAIGTVEDTIKMLFYDENLENDDKLVDALYELYLQKGN